MRDWPARGASANQIEGRQGCCNLYDPASRELKIRPGKVVCVAIERQPPVLERCGQIRLVVVDVLASLTDPWHENGQSAGLERGKRRSRSSMGDDQIRSPHSVLQLCCPQSWDGPDGQAVYRG